MIASPPGEDLFAPQEDPNIFGELYARGSGDWIYYRQKNGWITYSMVGKGRLREAAYIREGWMPLSGDYARNAGQHDYGTFDFLPYYTDHPFEVLFMRGGAREMPPEQVIALGYHLHPPLIPRCRLQVGPEHRARSQTVGHIDVCWRGAKPVQFPQLQGRTFAEQPPCNYCDRTYFASSRQRLQHIRVLHKDEMKELVAAQQIGQAVAGAMSGAASGGGLRMDEAEAARAEAEVAELDNMMLKLGHVTQDELLAASQGDDEPEAEPQRRPHRKRAE